MLPLQIKAPDMAFPRLNALSYWLYLLGGLVAASGFLTGGAAAVGWTFYSPLTSIRFSPGTGVDLAGAGLLLLILSGTASTVNFIVTILRLRGPGVTLRGMSMFSWSMLLTTIMMLVAFPVIEAGLLFLVADRHFGTHFFEPSSGGTLLWAHIFWFFGHPEVYIVLMPALGAVAEVLPVFSGRPLYGRNIIIAMWIIATALSFVVWAHHMFVTGIPSGMRKFMTITTELISVPFGITVLFFIATLRGGRIRFEAPMLFAIASVAQFLIGGITGVFLASSALDYHLRGGYFVVAHFHYTLVGGATFGLFAGVYYWFPRMTGRVYDERLAKVHWLGCVLGMNLSFFPLFFLAEMPRRIYTYPAGLGWDEVNLLASVGAFVFGSIQLVMITNLLRSFRRGNAASDNPWGGSAPEWRLPAVPQPGMAAAVLVAIGARGVGHRRGARPRRSTRSSRHRRA